MNIDKKKHQKYRAQKARAMWNVVKRLTRLPLREKAKVVVAQILPTLVDRAELNDTPWGQGERLLREMTRWITRAYKRSSAERLQQLTGIEGLQRQMLVTGAASVYASDLRKKAVRENIEGMEFKWMKEENGGIEKVEGTEEAELSDESRREGHTAAATTRDNWYLGSMATVMDAEMIGFAMGLIL